MTAQYVRQWTLPLSHAEEISLLADLEKILRLSPQWDVKSLLMEGPLTVAREFKLDVEYDRTEMPVSLTGKVEAAVPGTTLRLVMRSPEHTLDFSVEMRQSPSDRIVSFRIESTPAPQAEDLREYDLWARSIVNYIGISESRSPFTRMWKWFLDRWWLKMTQSGKRIVFFVVVTEGFSLLFLVAILLWWKWSSVP